MLQFGSVVNNAYLQPVTFACFTVKMQLSGTNLD